MVQVPSSQGNAEVTDVGGLGRWRKKSTGSEQQGRGKDLLRNQEWNAGGQCWGAGVEGKLPGGALARRQGEGAWHARVHGLSRLSSGTSGGSPQDPAS